MSRCTDARRLGLGRRDLGQRRLEATIALTVEERIRQLIMARRAERLDAQRAAGMSEVSGYEHDSKRVR